MKKIYLLPIILLLATLLPNMLQAQCAEPGSYHFETISDGAWSSSSTWSGGTIPPDNWAGNQRILITHQVTSTNEINPATNSKLFIKDGGSLTAKFIKMNNLKSHLIIDDGTLTLTGELILDYSSASICGIKACIKASNIEFREGDVALVSSGLKAGIDITSTNSVVSGSNIKLYAGNNITNSGTWDGTTIIAWYAGGSFTGFTGAPAISSPSTLEVCKETSDLKVEKTVDNSTATTGSSVTFTIIASNVADASEPNAIVQDLLPAGFTYVSHTVSTGTYDTGTGLWAIGALDVGQSQSMTLTATFTSTGTATNTAVISGDNPDPYAANNTASAAVTVGACIAPSISTQPRAAQTVNQNGTPANLIVTAAGTAPLTYQWYSNTTNSTVGGISISGATSSTYTPPTSTIGTKYYYVIVSGFCTPTATSSLSTVFVREAPQYCVTGCNDNTFINAVDPNTIEYDNIVGLYHSTLMKSSNQKVFVWGQNSNADGASNSLVPREISKANGYDYSGSILKFTGAEYGQFAVLTTTGLYIWGGDKQIGFNNY